ncbi:unnamed protein product [Rotaria sp. Silwood2]|nr:unnamed protein product [Rotaria sp. Silwood2]CAF4460869.1 unnamed protein product [Rotaria sp. Silwood2]CAF4504148.1 unnamed protein product [Rotaria sp. Silwood2]
MYPLHDNYCLQLVRDSSQCLNIELYHHGILTRIMSLNKDQCSTLTHSLCETINEFDVLITDLLETSMSNVSVTVDENLQMSFLIILLQTLEACIDPNACGFIVGSAGTVGTGAIDDLQGLAEICARRPNDRWFHVDGAIRCSCLLFTTPSTIVHWLGTSRFDRIRSA